MPSPDVFATADSTADKNAAAVSAANPPAEASPTASLPNRVSFFYQKQDLSTLEAEGKSAIAHLALYNDEDPTTPILEFDQMFVTEYQFGENERVQRVPLFRRQNQLYAFGRELGAVSLSVLVYDIQEQPNIGEGNGSRNQLQMLEYAHNNYFRASKLAEQRRRLILNIAGMTFRVAATDIGKGEVAGTPQLSTGQWRFIVLENPTRFTSVLPELAPGANPVIASEMEQNIAKQLNGGDSTNLMSELAARKRLAESFESGILTHAVSQEGLREALRRIGRG